MASRPSRSTGRSLGVAVGILTVAALCLGAGRVHMALTAAYPVADSLFTGPLREVRLRFSEAVQLPLSAISVLGPDGGQAVGPVEIVPGSENREIRVTLDQPPLSGSYTVDWRTAGPDGHVLRGTYAFMVSYTPSVSEGASEVAASPPNQAGDARGSGGDSTVQRSPRAMTESGVSRGGNLYGPGGLTLNLFLLGTIVGMVGIVVFRLGVVGRIEAEGAVPELVERIVGRLLLWGCIVAVVGLGVVPLRLAYQVELVGGSLRDGSLTFGILGSSWGASWFLHLAGVALFCAGVLLARRDREGRAVWGVAGVGALLAAVAIAATGHAVEGGAPRIAIDALHVVSAGSWLGGLACLVLVGIPAAARMGGDPPALSRVVEAFSRVALPAAVLLVLTGLLNVIGALSLWDLVRTPYGRLLLIKGIVACGAFSLGYYNWRVVRPSLAGGAKASALRIPATIEVTVGAAVVAITAALIVTAHP